MASRIRVEEIGTRRGDGYVELAGSVSGLRGAGRRRLWFRFPESLAGSLTRTADPFLAALLPSALASGSRLVIDGEVSFRLLEQVAQQMEIWCWQNPNWRPVAVQAAGVCRERSASRATGSFFSGGIDSFYTLLKNHDLERSVDRISYLMCVLGFDLWVDHEEMYRTVIERLQPVAAAVAAELVPIRTNIRELTDPYASWIFQQYGAGLAAVGLALGPLLGRVLIPSGDTSLISMRLSGANPLCDPLWSTDSTRFIHEGCEATRLQRIQWRIATSELALGHLRVCYANCRRGTPPRWNCGRCEKCVRTMVLLEAAGVLERCAGFAGQRLDLDRVARLPVDPRFSGRHLQEALALLEAEARLPELQAALSLALAPHRRFTGRARIILKSSLRRLLGRRGILLYRRLSLPLT